MPSKTNPNPTQPEGEITSPMNVTVHNYPNEAPIVNVSQPDIKTESPAINIIVDPTPINVQNTVNVPTQPVPDVKVENKIETPKREKKNVKIKYDGLGRPTELEG